MTIRRAAEASGKVRAGGEVGGEVGAEACVVCGEDDRRTLVDVTLAGGARATLCGSHALIHARALAQRAVPARNVAELRRLVADRRARRERREAGDPLGEQLQAAFSGERRALDRRAG